MENEKAKTMTDNVTPTLKPCPFCGGEADIHHMPDGAHAQCFDCEANSAMFDGSRHGMGRDSEFAREDAFEAWNARADQPAGTPAGDVTPTQAENDLIDRMTHRFLGWKLPDDFDPDAGINFEPEFNEHTDHPMRHEPSGTNLFSYTQAKEMVRAMLAGEATQAAEIARLREALVKARTALHQHYLEWDGEPEDAVPLQMARSACDAALSAQPDDQGVGK